MIFCDSSIWTWTEPACHACGQHCLSLRLTLSLTVLSICSSFNPSLHMTSTDRYVCMGCQAGVPAGHASYFPTYKAATCHDARSRACNQSNRGIRLVTIQSRSSDREAGGTGLVAQGSGSRGVRQVYTTVCTKKLYFHSTLCICDISHPFPAKSHLFPAKSHLIAVT
jgi:hypothetical protein